MTRRKSKLCNNPWIYENDEITDEVIQPYFGIVYLITDLETNRKYIGKKFLWSYRKVKGGTRRKKQESDWRRYYSSNEEIKKLAKETPERFKREILHLCKSKGECGYLEVAEQINNDVLYGDDYYNDNISGRYFKKNVSKYNKPRGKNDG